MIKYKAVRNRCSVYADGRFKRVYSKGRTVKAVKGSVGIMVFDKKSQAEDFIDGAFVTPDGKRACSVIRVETFGRGKRPRFLAASQSGHILSEFYKHFKAILKGKFFVSLLRRIPKGTICYHKVKVLD